MADVTLTLSALNKGNSDDRTGVYPLSSLSTEELGKYNIYIAKFADVPSAYNKKKIQSITFHLYAYPRQNSAGAANTAFSCASYTSTWDPTTINYNTLQYALNIVEFGSGMFNGAYWRDLAIKASTSLVQAYKLIYILKYGLVFRVNPNYTSSSDSWSPKFITKNTNAPYLVATFSSEDNGLSILSCSPTGGYQAKSQACTFNWSYTSDGYSITTPTVVSSTFRWRTDSSATATEIDCGTALTYTMPASTVSTDSFQWQCEIEDSNGNTSTSDWYTISTLEALSTVEIVEPKNVAIDGSQTTRFAWTHVISTGTAQTAADLQYSTNSGSTWSTLATVSGSTQYADIAAGTLSSGSVMWRVRTYNTDNNPGEWSSASITVVAAPNAPTVTSEQNPRPTITWQSSGQQAYRVVIDDVFDSGPLFGIVTTYKLPIYLNDGTYTVGVSIQNEYGLWSDYGTAPIVVANTSGNAITLTSSVVTSSTQLDWDSSGYSAYLIYRDGDLIGKTGGSVKTFTDYTAIGDHTYFVRGIYTSSSNYGKSNELQTSLTVDSLTIIDLEESISMVIDTSESSFATITIAESNVYAMTHITSNDYPLLEKSRYKEKNISFDCAFKLGDSRIEQFEGLFAKDVCIKTPSGTAVIGNILENSKTENIFYTAYQCSVLQIAWDEVIDID